MLLQLQACQETSARSSGQSTS